MPSLGAAIKPSFPPFTSAFLSSSIHIVEDRSRLKRRDAKAQRRKGYSLGVFGCPPAFFVYPVRSVAAGLIIALGLPGLIAAAGPDDLAGLPAFVEGIRADWGVPGVAFAVVRGDRIVSSGGSGTLGVHDTSPVTAESIFAIGSPTKAFTATAAAMLIDEEVLEWDTPVRTILPDFHLRNGQATLNSTLKDLLTHRTGLPRHDALWYRSDLSRDQMIHHLRYLESSSSFRDRFQYSNLMYMVAGRMIGRATNSTWEALVQRRIFDPLGMSRTFFEKAPSTESNVAQPHRLGPSDTALAERAYTGWAIGPALSVVSTAKDMGQWLKVQLTPGHSERHTVLPAQVIRHVRQPVIALPAPGTLDSPLTTYALGWFVQTYRGRLLVYHAGAIDGYYSLVAFLPFADIGIVVLTNRSRNRIPEVVSRWVFDQMMGLDRIDWNSRFKAEHQALLALEKAEWDRINALKDLKTPPSFPLEAYAGAYDHPAYGRMTIDRPDGTDLNGQFRDLGGWLEHLADELSVKYHGTSCDADYCWHAIEV